MRRYISFDWAIKSILRDKANFDVLEGLLCVLLDTQNIKIKSILESERNKNSENHLYMLAEDEFSELLLFEIQYLRGYDYLHEMLFGTRQTIPVNSLYEKVHKTYCINIVDFDLGVGKDFIYISSTNYVGMTKHDDLQLNEPQKEKFLSKGITYYLLSLHNFEDTPTTPIEEWVDFLKNGTIKEDTEVPGLNEAKKKLAIINLSDYELCEYKNFEQNLHYRASIFETYYSEDVIKCRTEGLKMGRAKGLKEGAMKERIANVLSLSKMLSSKQISEALNLTLEEVEEILKGR